MPGGDLNLAIRVRAQLGEAVRGLNRLGKELRQAGDAGGEADAGVREAAEGIDALEGQSEVTGRAVSRLDFALGGLAANLAAAAVSQGLAAVRDSLRELVGFETSLSRITGLVGVAAGEVDAMGRSLLALAPGVGRGPGELADALFAVTSAGARGAGAIDVVRQSARAAAAGLGDTATVADAVTSAMNAYGDGVLDAGAATGVLVAAVREGKLEAASLAPALGRVLPIASELGVEFGEIAAGVAALSRVGLSAAESVTAIRAALQAIQKPSQGAVGAAEALGLSFEDLARTLRDRGLLAALSDMRAATEAQGGALSDLIPEIEGLTAAMYLTGRESETVAAIFASVLGAGVRDLDAAFSAAADTVEFRFAAAAAETHRVLIALGADALPIVAGALRVVAGNMDLVVGALGGLLAWRAAPVLLGLATGLRGVARAGGVASAAVIALNAALRANPAVLFATAIGAATAALVAYATAADDAADATRDLHEAEEDPLRRRRGALEVQISDVGRSIREIEAEVAALEQAGKALSGSFGALSPRDPTAVLRADLAAARTELAALTDELARLDETLARRGAESIGDVEYAVATTLRGRGAAADGEDPAPDPDAQRATDAAVAIRARAENEIARLTLDRHALIGRAEARQIAALRALGAERGADAAAVEAAVTAVQRAAREQRFQAALDEAERLGAAAEEQAERQASRAEAHEAAAARIESAEAGLAGTYAAAALAARRARDETLAALDETAEGYEALAARAEAVYRERIAGAAAAAAEEQAAAAEAAARASRDWRDGAVRGLEDYADAATDAAAQAEAATARAFRGMEDALVSFVTTGQANFADLVNSMLADIARLVIRQSITGPLAGALAGALGDVFGGGGGTPAPAAASSGNIFHAVYHSGGLAGAPGGVRRSVPPALFAAAPRLHGGGIAGLRADEVPAILQRGETVLPRGALAPAAPPITVEIHNEGTPQQGEAREPRFDGERWVISVVTRDLDRGGPIRSAVTRLGGAGGGALG